MSEARISAIKMLEKVVTIDGKVSAAHNRVDKLEILLRDDLGEIKKDLKEVMGWMNRGKGWAAASLFLSGILGGTVTAVISFLVKH